LFAADAARTKKVHEIFSLETFWACDLGRYSWILSTLVMLLLHYCA